MPKYLFAMRSETREENQMGITYCAEIARTSGYHHWNQRSNLTNLSAFGARLGSAQQSRSEPFYTIVFWTDYGKLLVNLKFLSPDLEPKARTLRLKPDPRG